MRYQIRQVRPQLVFKKAWPWIIVEAVTILVVIGAAVMMGWSSLC